MSDFWNPADPYSVGNQWAGILDGDDPVDTSRELGISIRPVSAGPFTRVGAFMPAPGDDGSDLNRTLLATIYERDQEHAYGDVVETEVVVSAGQGTGSIFGGAATIPDAVNTPNDPQGYGLLMDEELEVSFDVDPADYAGRRILDIRVRTIVHSLFLTSSETRLDVEFTTTQSIGRYNLARSGPRYQIEQSTGETAYLDPPRVLLPLDLGEMNSIGAPLNVRMVNVTPIEGGAILIGFVRATIVHCDENRVASAALRVTAASWSPGWQSLEITDLTDGEGGITLTPGTDYTVTLTSASTPQFDPLGASAQLQVDPQSDFYQGPSGIGTPRRLAWTDPDADNEVPDAITRRFLRLTDGRLGVEMGPVTRLYPLLLTDEEDFSGLLEGVPWGRVQPGTVTSTVDFAQEVQLATASDDYELVRFRARRVSAAADLTVTCSSGPTAVLTDEAFLALPEIEPGSGWRAVSLPLSGPVDADGGVEVVTFTTAGAGGYWEIAAQGTDSTFEMADNIAEATYEGTTLSAIDDGTPDETRDAFVVLSSIPTQIGAPVITLDTQELESFECCDDETGPCRITALGFIHTCWDDAVDAEAFVRYELQRMDELDATWRTIAEIDDPTTLCWDDYEARIDVISTYRVRWIRDDTVPSPWSSSTAVDFTLEDAITPPLEGGLLLFTSSADPAANLAYAPISESSPSENFTFPEADDVVLQELYLRDFVVAFRPLERGGVRFTRTLLVNVLCTPPIDRTADEAFRPLRDLAWDTLPYVCVRDDLGNRWLATVRVPDAVVRRSANLQLATVEIIQITETPAWES